MANTKKKETEKRGYGRSTLAAAFVLAFALAFLAAWLIFSPKEAPPAPQPAPAPVVRLGEEDLSEFFAAAGAGDFEAMGRLGGELFVEGAVIPDSARVLAEYETNSFPPHVVYAFHYRTDADKVYRVLLTLDEKDRVVSFLAEQMTIAR